MHEKGQFTHETNQLTVKQTNQPTNLSPSSALETSRTIYISCSPPELRNPTGDIMLALDTDRAMISF